MKMTITIDVDVSKTMAQTMKRNGFNVIPEGVKSFLPKLKKN